MSGSNPFVNPSVIQPSNPFNTINEYNGLMAAKQQQALYPGQQQEQQIAIQQGQLANQGAQLGITQKQNSLVGAYTRQIAGNPSATSGDLYSAIGQAQKAGLDTSGVSSDLAEAMTQPGFSPQKWAQQHLGNDMSAPDSVGYFQGTPGVRQDGSSLQPLVTAGGGQPNFGGQTPVGSATPLTISPEGQSTQVDHPASPAEAAALNVPIGTTVTQTLRQRLIAQGQGQLVGAGSGPQAGPGGLGGVSGNAGPVGPQNPPRLNQTPGAAQNGSVVTARAPGDAELQAANVGDYHTAQAKSQTYAEDMFPLQHAQAALAAAPTGAGTGVVHDVSSILGTFAPNIVQKGLAFVTPVMTPDQVASYDEAKKYTTQVGLSVPGASRSDAGGSTAAAASPSVSISPKAAQVVLSGMMGLRRMQQDALLSFQQTGQPPQNYGNFQTQFATKANPAVYAWDSMSSDQQKSYYQNLPAAKRSQFASQVTAANQRLGGN